MRQKKYNEPSRPNDMEKLPDILSKLKKEDQDAYRVPEGYFDSLSARVLTKLDQEDQAVAKMPRPESRRKWYQTFWRKPISAAALGLASLLLIVMLFPRDANEYDLSQISDETLEEYLADALINEDIAMLEEYIPLDDMSPDEEEYIDALIDEIELDELESYYYE